ncbi:MAG TPA: NAD(P)-dependent oxidoreductase [Saprospiraceae bacterium]|nr:NAD(P)-dependent oxidoreductase [Saprospiraceae bacterium]HMQ84963.1 NAD(P)-dependent oxidoreductase [Saprospiraceae bacterium]
MKIGIIREGKIPPDSRVPLIPEQCAQITRNFPVKVVVQPSPKRCYPDEAYHHSNIQMQDDVSDCDLLMGVKEVPVDQLIANKTYCFFSHTIKKQPYNRKLLQAILEKNIRMVDYETMVDDSGKRLIAFGKFAGMVGAHNALLTYGKRTGLFQLKPMHECLDYAEAKSIYKTIQWPIAKIVLTGHGRVGLGAAEVLRDMGIKEVSPHNYLNKSYDEMVFTILRSSDYIYRKDGLAFDTAYFYKNPAAHGCDFTPYYQQSDIMINGIYWDNNAPPFFTIREMQSPDFKIKVIADVTCDIAPLSSIPSTLRASTISNPIFGFDPFTGQESEPHQVGVIDMMTIDNLPNEMPRDASKAFGEQFIRHILPEFLQAESPLIDRATIAKNGSLCQRFAYLEDFVTEKCCE